MVSLKQCFIHIPAIPNMVTVSGRAEIARFGYATTNTNYLGFTSCSISSKITPTALGQEFSTTKCALPASVSGKAYSVTPVVVFTPAGSYVGTTRKCDPVPAASINKGNFQLACKTVSVKTLEAGYHTISWQVPAAASVSIIYNLFPIVKPSTTPVYVVSPTKASTTLIPVTWATVTATSTRSYTIATPTSWVRIPTATSTCTVTVTVTQAAAARRREIHLEPHPRPQNENPEIDLLKKRATPTLAKIDFTYPPYGKSTVFVKSFSTNTYTWWSLPVQTVTPPGVVITTSVVSYATRTVTVTKSSSTLRV
ncbi:hypothetical protein QBC34DRAFT_389667 [Podospora aff. communis PSN243]|uniref:Uncharacterized protein n=1 Tax=Podospora aff. communis PSN243 TaxID=3040156 RepID=A0AAV9H5W4_9PEZI|nr:hypothetical protein QBC34DRAFT_389667 [Podospora aff. communis PSN243]